MPDAETSGDRLRQRYQVLALLGQGGMSLVHLAALHGAGDVKKLLALKSARPEVVADERASRMFLDEARLTTRLSHPNVVQTYDVTLLAGRPVLIMEYMEGQSLWRIRNRCEELGCAVPLAVHLRILQDALLGLDYAHNLLDFEGHALNPVHRDVSPQNVFVTYDGHTKILDFGIAKVFGAPVTTDSGAVKGKIRYMAPEQMMGERELDRRADVFSVGVLLWEALTGRRLWAGLTDAEVVSTMIVRSVPAPSSLEPKANPRLEAICMRALATNRDERYESASQLQSDLETATEELRLRATPRDVARFMLELFDDVRIATRKAIERRLKQPNLQPLDLTLVKGGEFKDDATSTDPLTNSGVLPLEASPGFKRRTRWVPLLIIAGAFAVVAVYHARTTTKERSANAVSSPDAAQPIAAPKPSLPIPADVKPALKVVKVFLSARPPEAKLYLDGKLLTGNPYSTELASDTAKHELRAEAPNFQSKSAAISLTAPVHVELILEPALRPTAGPASRSRAPPGAATPAKAICDSPLYTDSTGIRRVRKECLEPKP